MELLQHRFGTWPTAVTVRSPHEPRPWRTRQGSCPAPHCQGMQLGNVLRCTRIELRQGTGTGTAATIRGSLQRTSPGPDPQAEAAPNATMSTCHSARRSPGTKTWTPLPPMRHESTRPPRVVESHSLTDELAQHCAELLERLRIDPNTPCARYMRDAALCRLLRNGCGVVGMLGAHVLSDDALRQSVVERCSPLRDVSWRLRYQSSQPADCVLGLRSAAQLVCLPTRQRSRRRR